MADLTDQELQSIVQQVKVALKSDFQKRIGDTPTDAFQLTPKRYVTSVIGNVNSSIAGAISAVNNRIYAGTVLANGSTATPFPANWTASIAGTGQYSVTHNLGTTNYTVVGCTAFTSPTDERGVTFNTSRPLGSNSFSYVTGIFNNNGTGQYINSDACFIVITT